MKAVVYFLLGVIAVTLAAIGAKAEGLECRPAAAAISGLYAEYGEVMLWQGLIDDTEARIVVMANPKGSTWTILGLLPNGMACALNAGSAWKVGDPPPNTDEEG
jgi:hypothetical protein